MKLTYLFGHYNLLQVLASANLRRHTSRTVAAWRQFRIPSVLRFSSTCLAGEAVLVCDIHHLAQIRRYKTPALKNTLQLGPFLLIGISKTRILEQWNLKNIIIIYRFWKYDLWPQSMLFSKAKENHMLFRFIFLYSSKRNGKYYIIMFK